MRKLYNKIYTWIMLRVLYVQDAMRQAESMYRYPCMTCGKRLYWVATTNKPKEQISHVCPTCIENKFPHKFTCIQCNKALQCSEPGATVCNDCLDKFYIKYNCLCCKNEFFTEEPTKEVCNNCNDKNLNNIPDGYAEQL